MTSIPRTLFIAAVILGIGTAVCEHLRATGIRHRIDALRAGGPPTTSQGILSREREEARAKLASLAKEIKGLQAARADLLKLRAEAATLRKESRSLNQLEGATVPGNQTAEDEKSQATVGALATKVASLKQALQQAPAHQVPELCLLEEQDWIKAAREAKLESEGEVAKSLSYVRTLAKEKLIPMMNQALLGYVEANNGQLPAALTQLGPYFQRPVDDSIFQRYELLKTGDSRDLAIGEMVIGEKNRLTPSDSIFMVGLHGWGSNSPDQ